MSSPEEHPQPRGKFCNKDFLLFFPKPYTLHFFYISFLMRGSLSE